MDWKNKLHMIQNKVKFQIHAKLIDDLEVLKTVIERFDTNNTGNLDKDEFTKFLASLGVFLTTQELRIVYENFDLNKDASINYFEFINMIRSTMSEKRLSTVKATFDFLSGGRSQILYLEDLFKKFKPEEHPRVRCRQKTADEIMESFHAAISKKSKDGVSITEEDFLDYYVDVNATLPMENEEYFVDMLLKTWGLTESSYYISEERLHQIETILFEKIRQKTKPQEDIGKTIYRAFKYFDLSERGVVDINQFTSALDKFGCKFGNHEINAIFNLYDADKSGKICYDEFANIFARMDAGTNPNINPVFRSAREAPVEIMKKVKKELTKNGWLSVRTLGKLFKQADKNKTGNLDRTEFYWALKEMGISLTKNESDKLFLFLDKNFDDQLVYEEFMRLLRDQVNEKRLTIIKEAFNKLDSEGKGHFNLQDLKANFDVSDDPKVKAGKISAEEVLLDFLNLWDTIKKDGLVTYEEFENFFRDASCVVESDAEFGLKMKQAFKI